MAYILGILLPKRISEEQSAFLKGRGIEDNLVKAMARYISNNSYPIGSICE
jgi:predicted GNAT family acetyltransferase